MEYEKLNKIYDNQIRKLCEKYKKRVDNCLNENFNDEFVCEVLINQFSYCVKNFDVNFKKKYKLEYKLEYKLK